MFLIEREILSEELDKEYGHLHHARSICLLEETRLEYLKCIGYPNELLLKEGLFLVLTHLSVRYLRELFNFRVSVTCENMAIKSRLIVTEQRIILPSGEDAVTAVVHCMCLSKSKARAIAPPERFRQAFLAGEKNL